MIWKLLLMLAVLFTAYQMVRRYWRNAVGIEMPLATAPPEMRRLAAAVLIVMGLGTAVQFILSWQHRHEVIQVQVVNANTGQLTLYQVQRGSIDGRYFRTIDGREMRMADVERMIILPAETND
ncbi:hypothetical protein CXB77_07605 [Chromatium okenii]|uniref:Antitermination protein NusG n=2 Tax=Chromatium okenii TaxID=61644 RepID=A0A2S7XSD3_9GAMM|nr:hypothetical protein CXB77_07605 [Chromatium okenii]